MPLIAPANIILSLLAALFWGSGDFAGGMAVKRGGSTLVATLRVLFFSHLIGLFALLSLVLLRHDTLPQLIPLLWALVAGLIAGISIVCFFFALAQAPMGAAAALSGLLAAAIPAALTLVQEGSPGALKLFGFLLAGIAIWYIAATPSVPGKPSASANSAAIPTLLLAILAGIGFGLYFIALKMAGTSGVLWPMVVVRVGSLSACGLMFLGLALRNAPHTAAAGSTFSAVGDARSATPSTLPSRSILSFARWIVLAAILGTGGDLTFLAATRAGRLDIASVVASMYPASTILLAAWLLHERLTRRQTFGMVLALLAVVLITL